MSHEERAPAEAKPARHLRQARPRSLKRPAPQLLQADWPPAAALPSGHGWHSLLPLVEAERPGGQGTLNHSEAMNLRASSKANAYHWSRPGRFCASPRGHSVHEPLALYAENLPASHRSQESADCREKRPATQSWQTEPRTPLNLPAVQVVQPDELPSATEPSGLQAPHQRDKEAREQEPVHNGNACAKLLTDQSMHELEELVAENRPGSHPVQEDAPALMVPGGHGA